MVSNSSADDTAWREYINEKARTRYHALKEADPEEFYRNKRKQKLRMRFRRRLDEEIEDTADKLELLMEIKAELLAQKLIS